MKVNMDILGRSKSKSYKVIVLGEAGVGKSSLIRRYTQGYFSSQTTTTVGVDRIPVNIIVDNDTLNFQVLDTAGCFAFHGLIKSYVNNIDAVIFVYDLTNKESFACLPLWSSIIRQTVNRDLVQILVGNKRDLAVHREVNFKNAKNYAEFEGMVAMEISVKEEESVDLVFQCVARELRLKCELLSFKKSQENKLTISPPPRPRTAEPVDEEKDSPTKQIARRFSRMFKSRKNVSYSKSDSALTYKHGNKAFSRTEYMKTDDYFKWF